MPSLIHGSTLSANARKTFTIRLLTCSSLKNIRYLLVITKHGNNFIAVIENYLSSNQISQGERNRLGRLFR